MGETTFMLIIFLENILSWSNIHVIIILDSIIVAIYFYLIYYSFVLTFTPKGAISFPHPTFRWIFFLSGFNQ